MAEQVARANPLEAELLANRERYNTLFAVARRARPRLEGPQFLSNLECYLAPLVAIASPRVERELVAALYPLILELSGLELFQRSPAVRSLWSEVLPATNSLVVQNPSYLASSLTNAVYNLEREPGADWRFWLNQMLKTSSHCSEYREWLKLGQVLAWVSGMAHYRESASALAAELPTELVELAVPRWDRVKNDPWWARRPAPGRLQVIYRVGAFVGYGGAFRKPPEVVTAGPNKFLVSDGTDDWLLCCDGFGATLKRVVDASLSEEKVSDVKVSREGEVTWAGQTFTFPELAPVASFDVSGNVVAVTQELSHAVYLLLGTKSVSH